jgi:hypothetical protein
MNKPQLTGVVEQIYDSIYEEENARVCRDISDEACTNVPHNFFLNAAAATLVKLADAIANTKTTLPWLLTSAGAPGWIISVLVPIRESGSMLPQLAIGGWIRKAPVRKWFYAGGAFVQALALLVIAIAISFLHGAAAGYTVLTAIIIFSVARGFCSIAYKDVIGKTVPKTRRGRVNGLASSIAGLGTLFIIAFLYYQQISGEAYIILILGAAAFFLVASIVYAQITEEPGADGGGANGLARAVASLRLLIDDVPFRNFVISRALLIGTALSAPFIVVLSLERSEAGLIYFLLAQGMASLLSGNFWGRFADHSSRRLLFVCGLLSGLLGTVLFSVDRLFNELTHSVWLLPLCFFLLMIIHDGVRLGRKTYVVDLGSAEKRTDYVAVSNTVIGVLLLVAAMVSVYAQSFGNIEVILLLSLLAFASCFFIKTLPEVQ